MKCASWFAAEGRAANPDTGGGGRRGRGKDLTSKWSLSLRQARCEQVTAATFGAAPWTAPQGAGTSDDDAQRPVQHRPPGVRKPPSFIYLPSIVLEKYNTSHTRHFQFASCHVKSKETGKSILIINFDRKYPRYYYFNVLSTSTQINEVFYIYSFGTNSLKSGPLKALLGWDEPPSKCSVVLCGWGLPCWTA